MTNTWQDIGLADVIMVIGGNPAENHPMGMRHVVRALKNYHGNTGPTGNGAKLIVVDPRFTRTAKMASIYNGKQMYTKMRSGTDIAFINGIIWYVINNNLYNRAYVLSYSNAGFLVHENFKKPGDPGQNGKYSGFTVGTNYPGLGDTGSYDKTTWQYCKYAPGQPNEYRGANIATDFWDGSGGVDPNGADYFSPNSNTTYTAGNLSLNPADATYIGNLRTDLFADGIIGTGEGFNPGQLTVWEHMQQHYSRYDKTTVINITGSDSTVYDDICQLYSTSGQVGKAACILYAMGTTQHTVGTQNIRAYSTLQILLGNMGLAGGGVNAQRGESNVQGSTDHCLLFHILPGYITQPKQIPGDAVFDQTNAGIGGGDPGHPLQLDSYVKRGTLFQQHANELNWWGFWNTQSNFKRYIVSLMKCYWYMALGSPNPNSPATQAQLQTVYDWIPKLPGNASHIEIFEQMYNGNIKGLFVFGQNPAVGGPNAEKERTALRNLDWLVVSELWETETAAFWQFSPKGVPLTDEEMGAIDTEVFLLPAACHLEKEGSVTNSSRWAQFRYKAVEPPGNVKKNGVVFNGTDGIPLGAKHEIWILNALYEELINLPYFSALPQMSNLTMGTAWYNPANFPGRPGDVPFTHGYADPSADLLDGEINGFYANNGPNPVYPGDGVHAIGDLVPSFTRLLDDGTTTAGNWLYTNMYTGGNITAGTGTNKSMKRDNSLTLPIPIYPNWAWDWPVNRRIIYNGASLVPNGFGGVSSTPWDSFHPVITWGPGWQGDVNDGVGTPGPLAKRTPFIMKPEGHCRLHGMGRADGPYPEHYEPVDTLFKGAPSPSNPVGDHDQLINPVIHIYTPGQIGDPSTYPIVATTYRCTEHWQGGAQTRHLPTQVEMWPDVVVEMSQALAGSLKVSNGDKVKITTARGDMECAALVTNRFQTYTIAGEDVDHVGIFWHWGYKGIGTGNSANRLTPHWGDANTRIPEYKAFLCKIDKV